MADEWMSTKDIGRELGIAPETVRGLLVEDGVPVLKLKSKWRIKRTDFEAFVARRFKA